MRQLWAMTSRNLKQYLRDKGAVFFSLLSMLIVIMLMFLFLGDTSTQSVTDMLGQFPGRDALKDKENAGLLILAWTCAGIVSINAVTVTMSSLSYLIKDRETGRLNSIYTAPVNRTTIAASYILAAWLSSVIICTLTLAVTEVYCVFSGLPPFSLIAHLKLLGMIAANSFTYAALMYLIALVVKSQGAWGGVGTIISTLVGFLGGIYIPIGTLSGAIAAVTKCTPVIYGTTLFRREMTRAILEDTFAGVPDSVTQEFVHIMGIELSVGGHTLQAWQELTILLVCGLVFLAASVAIVRFGKQTDR